MTVLTGERGKLTVNARGALRRNSKFAAVTGLLTFSEMTLFCNRDRWTITEARILEQFIGLRTDLELVSLASYFAELVEAVADEDSPNPELLPLCLNALYVLSEGIKTARHVKPVFELRLLSLAGFSPLIDYCSGCENTDPEYAYLDISGGTILCDDCAAAGGIKLSRAALQAARYIITCDSKKLYSFSLSEEALEELLIAAESYLLSHLDRNFRTLEYYKGVS